jgi:putative sigma-54 modulation protein
MKIDFKFRRVDRSIDLEKHAVHRLERLHKYEWQPLAVHVTFRQEGRECFTEILLTGPANTYKASASANSYLDCIDLVVAKLQKQLERKKDRVKDHQVFENTHMGKIERHEREDMVLPEGHKRRAG